MNTLYEMNKTNPAKPLPSDVFVTLGNGIGIIPSQRSKYLISNIMKKQLFVLIVLFFAIAQAWAGTLTVGTTGTYATLGAALGAASSGDEIHILTAGSYGGFTYNAPGNLLIKNMSGGSVSITGASPALTVSAGILTVNGLTFTTTTNDPTILINGGKLVMRNCTVIESASFNQNGVSITSGELDAGVIGDPGHNKFTVNGAGKAVNNTGGIANALQNYWGSTDYIFVNTWNAGSVNFDPWCNSTFTQCNYTTQGGPITYAPGLVACASVISIPVSASNFNDIDAISLTLTYDPLVLSYANAFTPHSALTGGFWLVNQPTPGMLKIAWQSLSGVTIPTPPTPINIVTLTFNYYGGFSNLIWSDAISTDCEYSHALINGPYHDQPTSTYYINGWVTELPAPLAGPNVSECQQIPTQTLTATATPVAPGNSIVWYDAATGGNVVSPTLSTPGTVTYWAANSNGSCQSITRVPVTLHMDPKNIATIQYNNGSGFPHFCSNGAPANVIHTGTLGGIYSALPTGLNINALTGQITPVGSPAGTYTVAYTMQAVGLCPAEAVTTPVVITQLPTITTYQYDNSPFCFDAPNAMPNLVASHTNGIYSIPNPPFDLLFNNATGELFLGGLSPANTYNMVYTIPAAMGCPDVTKATPVTVRPKFSLTTSSTNETCDGALDGTATVIPTNGVTPLSYLWNTVPAQTTATATGLAHGTYSVTVTDANAPVACVQTATVVVDLEPLPNPVIQPLLNISTVTKTPAIIHAQVTYPTFTIPAGYVADALITSAVPFPVGAKVASVTYQQGANTVTLNTNFSLDNLSSVYLSDILGTAPTALAPHSGLTIDWTIVVEGFNAPATYPVTFQTVTYIDRTICVAPIGNAESFNLTFADLVASSLTPDPAQIMCDAVTLTFNIGYPAIINNDNNTGSILNNALITSNNPLPAATLTWSYNGNPGAPYTVAPGTTQIYLSAVTGMTAPLNGHSLLNDTWVFTLTGANLDAADYVFTVQNIAQLGAVDYVYNTETVDIKGLPVVSTTPVANIHAITNTPVIIHQTVTYPSVITALPAVMTDALINSSVAFPAGAVLETITYNQGSGTTTFNVNHPVGGLTQLFLSDVFGSATPLNGHAGLTIDWTFTLSGMSVAQTYGITITPIAYINKATCYDEIGAPVSFDLTYADLVSFAVSPDPAQIMCDQVQFGFNIQYPAIQNIDNNTGVIKNNALITSNVALPAATINWTYNGNPGAPYSVAPGTTQLYLSDITGMVAPLQGHGNLNDTWMFTITGAGIAANDYTFSIQNVAQLGGNYIYNTSTIGIIGLPTVTLAPIASISTITKTPVIVPATVTYPAVITAQNSVLTDALFTTSVPFPAGAVVESVTYDQGSGTTTFPVNFAGFNGSQTSFYLSDILGSAAYPLNGHAGLTVNWTFTISGFANPYNGVVTVTPVAYQTKGLCESVIGNAESFNLVFADLVSYTVTPASPIAGCDNEATFTVTVSNPAVVNVHTSITTDAKVTSNVALPAGTVIGWSYNGSPVSNYTLAAPTTSFYLSALVGTSYPIVAENLVTAAWTFTVTVPNTAVATYLLTLESMAKLGTSEYVYYTENVTLNIAPTPVVVTMDLTAQLGTGSPYAVAGTFPNYDLCLDPAATSSYIIDIASLTSNIALAQNFYNPFYLPTTPSAALLAYWAARGVTATSTGWQAQMWQIINGLAPMVYIHFDGSDYTLVDGLQYSLYGGTPPMTIPGDYPEDVYVLTGQVKEAFNGCLSAPFSVNMSLNTVPLLSVTGTDVTCYGANNGTIDLTVVGSHTPFSYYWTGPTVIGNIQDPTNLAPGTYMVYVTDDKGCNATISYTINEPAELLVTSITAPVFNGGFNISCNGYSDGNINLTVQGGTAPYNYAWTAPVALGNVEDPANVPAGIYTVLVTDANGCTATASITLTQPDPLVAQINTYSNVSCFGFNNGSATVTVTGGYTAVNYQYAWTPSGQTTATAINLAPITHSVQVTDDNGCVTTAQITLTEPAEVLAPTNPVHITVCGQLPVTQTITAAATVPAGHSIVWYNAATGGSVVASPTLNTVGAVTYWAEAVNNTTNCVSLTRTAVNLQIDQPASANIAYLDNPYCSNEDFAYVTRTGTPGGFPGGTPGGTYFAYQPGLSIAPTTGTVDISLSIPGTYTIGYVMPANGTCPSTITTTSLTIEQLPAATISYNTPFCHNGTVASPTIVGTQGGLFSYYSWPSLALNTITGDITLGGASMAGTYTVFYSFPATLACPQVNTSTTVQVLNPVAVSIVNVTSETCVGTNDGTITTDITGFVAPVTFTWTGPTTIGNVQNPIGLAQGTYNVTVTDIHGCTGSATATVNGVDPLIATITLSDVTCNGYNDGAIQITGATGGYGAYEFSINGGSSWQTSGSFTGLIAGTYDVHMRDLLYPTCFVDLDGSLNTVINEPLPVTATVSSTNIICYGAADGTITISGVAGGQGTYEYSIDGGSTWGTTAAFTGLTPGAYVVVVRDAVYNYCQLALGTISITQPAQLSATVYATNVTCYNAADGVIAIYMPMGGFGTYEFSIDGGINWQSNPFFTALTPGTYNVWIRDAAYTTCTIDLDGTANTVITQPDQLTATVSSTNITCNGANDGTITITAPAGGFGSYEFSIDGGSNWSVTMSYTGLAPQTYNVMMRDAVYTYCFVTLNAALTITEPAAVTATVASTNVTCYGAANGTITISNVSGGYGTYEYSINGGSSWSTLTQYTNLAPGAYNVLVRDAQNTACVTDLDGTVNTVITQPGKLLGMIISPVLFNGYNISCNGVADGQISTYISGGTTPYQYIWTGPVVIGNVPAVTGVPAGNYSVTVVDDNGCSTTLNTTLTEPALLGVAGTSAPVSCPGSSDGTIDITVTGGVGPYTFMWTGPSVIGNIEDPTGLLAGTYDLTVVDANGCSVTTTVVVNTTPDLTAPTFSCPTDITVAADNGLCSAALTITIPVATDNCDPNPVVTGVRSDNLALTAPYPVGVTTILWTATDINGQFSTCTQTITVFDNQAPTIVCPANVNSLYTAGNCYALVNVGLPLTSDNCGVSSVVGVRSDNLAITDPYYSGLTTITWTVIDQSNNAQSCQQTVNVTPTELLMLYNFNYATQYPISPDYIAPAMQGYCTSFEPFLLTSTGTPTGPLAFISDINYMNNNGLAMAQSNGNNIRYFEFRVYGDSLYKYRDYKLYLQGRRQAQAATQIALYYSFDGVTFWPGDSLALPAADTWFEDVLDLTGFDTINYTKNLYMRLYVRGSNVVSGATRFDIDNFQLVAINGPIARPDFATVQANGSVTINVLGNDEYGCNGPDAIFPIFGMDVPANGTSTLNPNGTFTYVPDPNFVGQDYFTYRICDGIGNCDTAIVRISVVTPDLYLAPKVFLQGAYDAGSGMMNDNLRTLGFIPTTQPYSSAPYAGKFTHVLTGGAEVTTPAVLAVTGPNAIVDWVFIELRDKNNNANVIATRAALVQRDGDVVDVDGVSPVKFSNLVGNEYYVAIRHRNHLGVMSANTIFLNLVGAPCDFTNGSVAEFNFGIQNNINYATLAQKDLNPGVRGLHAGNADPDNKVKYQGAGSDRNAILTQVLNHPGNTLFEFNYNFATGYYSGDINMDGQVKYQGAGNDSNFLLNMVLNYTTGTTPIFDFMIEQIP